MIPRCPACNSLTGTSRTAAGKRMWCVAYGCTWSTVVAEAALTGRDMCAVGHCFDHEGAATPGQHPESDVQIHRGKSTTGIKGSMGSRRRRSSYGQ